MKKATISTRTHEIMLMELPSADSDYYIAYENIRPETYISTKPLYGNPKTRNLYAGIWEPLGLIPYLQEKRVEPIVERSIYTGNFAHYVKGVEKPNIYCYGNALESFLSLLETEIYWENPLPKPDDEEIEWFKNQFYGDFSERYTSVFEWREAQSRTFDKARTIVFVKKSNL